MLRFRRTSSLQEFAAVHVSNNNHFDQERHHYSRINLKLTRAAVLAEWRNLGVVQGAPSLSSQRLVRIGLKS